MLLSLVTTAADAGASLPAPAGSMPTPSLSVPWDHPGFILVIIALGLPTLVGALNGILQIIRFFRPDPPVHKEYATKAELREAEERFQDAVTSNEEKFDELETRINKSRDAMELRVREDIAEVKQTVSQESETTQRRDGSLQAELKDIHKQLGRVLGTLDAMSKRRASG